MISILIKSDNFQLLLFPDIKSVDIAITPIIIKVKVVAGLPYPE